MRLSLIFLRVRKRGKVVDSSGLRGHGGWNVKDKCFECFLRPRTSLSLKVSLPYSFSEFFGQGTIYPSNCT